MSSLTTIGKALAQHVKLLVRPTVFINEHRKVVSKLLLTRFHHSMIMQERAQFSTDFFFRQLFDDVSCTYSYLLGDVVTKEAILIDPGWNILRSAVTQIIVTKFPFQFWKRLPVTPP